MNGEGISSREKSPPIHIERATGDDAHGLREVQRETWHTYANEKTGITPDDVTWYFDSFKKAFSDASLKRTALELQEQKTNEAAFVAKDQQKIVGYVWAMTYPTHNELGALYVLPSYQGQHVGFDLWNQARSFFDPELPTIVTVNKDNATAIAFYGRLGFEPTEEEISSGLVFPSGATFQEIKMVRPSEEGKKEYRTNHREMFTPEDVAQVAKLAEASGLKRIFVTGVMGSGKSTFSSQLAREMGLSHIELDQYSQIFRKETGAKSGGIGETARFALAKEENSYIVDHAELLGKGIDELADMIVLLNPSHDDIVRSYELRKQAGAEGDWSKFDPDALEKFAQSVARKFDELPGKIVYENKATGVSVKQLQDKS